MSRPLAPAPLHILLALIEGPSHGYAIMQAVREQSAGQVPLGTGSFYRHLARLLDAGLVIETQNARAGDDPRRSAYYRLTPRGRQALAAEKQRLASLVAALDAVGPVPRKGSG